MFCPITTRTRRNTGRQRGYRETGFCRNGRAHWETMWKAAGSLTDHTMFPPALLDDTKFAILQSDDKLSVAS